MKLIHHLGRRLARIPWVAGTLREGSDLSAFRQRPSFRLVVGLSLMALSYPICWPLIAVLGYLAFHWGRPLLIVVGGPLAYGFSTLVFYAGVFVAGKDMLRYSHLLLRWLVRTTTMKMLGPEGSRSASGEARGATTSVPNDQGAEPGSAAASCTSTSTRSSE